MKSLGHRPVARRFRHRAAVGSHDGIRQQDERQMLPVVRRRALLSIPDGHAAGRDPPHLQRLCRLLPPQFHARPDRAQMCGTAKSQCLQSGVYVGPYSGMHFAGMQKM